MPKETFKELVEILSSHHGWDCYGENHQVWMYEKKIEDKLVRLNIYPNRTVHPQTGKKFRKSFKKVSDKVLENIFADPFKNPYEQKSIPVPVSEKSNEKVLIPIQDLINEIRDLKQRVSDLEQAFADHRIIYGGEEPKF